MAYTMVDWWCRVRHVGEGDAVDGARFDDVTRALRVIATRRLTLGAGIAAALRAIVATESEAATTGKCQPACGACQVCKKGNCKKKKNGKEEVQEGQVPTGWRRRHLQWHRPLLARRLQPAAELPARRGDLGLHHVSPRGLLQRQLYPGCASSRSLWSGRPGRDVHQPFRLHDQHLHRVCLSVRRGITRPNAVRRV
jgi:hypothetical protein